MAAAGEDDRARSATAGTGIVVHRAARQVRLALPWANAGLSVPVFAAKAFGDWDENNLDVMIETVQGSIDAVDALIDGRFDFVIAAASAAIHRRASCGPLVAIAACGDDSRMGICVPADSALRVPSDLAGTRLGFAPGSAEFQFLPEYARRAGIDLSQIETMALPPDERENALARQEVGAIAGFAGSMVPMLEALGCPARTFLFRDVGLDLGGHALIARSSTLRDDGAMCQAIVAGLLHAMHFVLLHPEESLALLRLPSLPTALAQMRRAVAFSNHAMLPVAREHGLGWSDPARYATLAQLVSPRPGDPECLPEEMFTNRFAEVGPLPRAEWLAAAALASASVTSTP
jgi:NitT/TauT family transport system substrate-binding protein